MMLAFIHGISLEGSRSAGFHLGGVANMENIESVKNTKICFKVPPQRLEIILEIGE